MSLTFGSVCSGIEAASVAWKPLGWRCAFMSEIEAFPRAVLAHHYPDVPLHGDFTTIKEGQYEPIDVLVGGTPCQSFSVAGLRGGMADARGNLALEFLKLADRLKPRFIVWENVPGVLSSNDGKDFTSFLDGLESIGYVVDVDILDAQYFGLAQRRRRVFVCAERVENILKAKTLSSGLTVVQCLMETLLLTLAALSSRSVPERENLTFDASDARRSLQKRMQLFGLHRGERVSMLAENLAALRLWSGCAPDDWASPHGSSSAAASRNSGDTKSSASNAETETWRAEFLSTGQSWSDTLAASLRIANECITSTAVNETTESRIYTCAQTALHIAAHITQSMNSSPSFWNAALSASTAVKAFTNYARSASSDLFTGVEWLRAWGDFLAQAERADKSLGHLGDRNHGSEILPLSESLRGDSAPRREAGERAAACLTFGAHPGGHNGEDDAKDGRLIPVVANPLGAKKDGGWRGDLDNDTYVTAYRTSGNCGAWDTGDTTDALTTGSDPCSHVLTLAIRGRGDSHDLEIRQDGTANALLTPNSQMHVAGNMAVRRLTPVEAARLQGFSDTYLDITFRGKPAADGNKYRALGNSFAVPVVRWIGERISAVDARQRRERAA